MYFGFKGSDTKPSTEITEISAKPLLNSEITSKITKFRMFQSFVSDPSALLMWQPLYLRATAILHDMMFSTHDLVLPNMRCTMEKGGSQSGLISPCIILQSILGSFVSVIKLENQRHWNNSILDIGTGTVPISTRYVYWHCATSHSTTKKSFLFYKANVCTKHKGSTGS